MTNEGCSVSFTFHAILIKMEKGRLVSDKMGWPVN